MTKKHKKITLYDPQVDEKEKLVNLPIELLAISSLLYKDYEIKIFDCRDDKKEVVEHAKDSICFGLTCLTGFQISDGLEVAKAVREANPKVPIVWGGWHPSLLPEQTMQNEYVDIIVRGQGERTFYELVKALEKGNSLKEITGISYKKSGKIIHNHERPRESLNNFPPLPYHLIDFERYLIKSYYGKRVVGYIASQGCPYNCSFCADRAIYKGIWKGLDAKRVLSDLKFLKEKYKIDGVLFLDNNFFVNEERDREIMQGLIKLNLGWGRVLGRVNVLLRYSDDTWELMKKSKLHSIIIGAESGLDENLKMIRKGFLVKDIIAFHKKCKEYGIGVVSSLFIGVPGKSPGYLKKEFDGTFDLMYKLWTIDKDKNAFLFFTFIPYPGSPLYETAKQNGFKEPESLEEWARFNFINDVRKVRIQVPWVSKKYSRLVEIVPFYFLVASKKYYNLLGKFNFPLRQFLGFSEFLFRKIVMFRLKTRVFALPLEYYVVDWFFRFKRERLKNV